MMRYVIITGTTVVDATDNEYGAIEYATKTNPGATYLPFATKEEILTDPQYIIGQYIIANVRTSTLLEKTKVIIPGRLYNSDSFVVNIIDSWTIMSVADDVQKAYWSHGSHLQTLPSIFSGNVTMNQLDTNGSYVKAKIITTKITASDPDSCPIIISAPVPIVPITPTIISVVHPIISVPSVISVTPSVISVVHPSIPKMIPPTTTLPVVSHKKILPSIPLSKISSFPLVMSIGEVNKKHREKIEMLIYNNIAIGSLKEENVVIVTNDDLKITNIWTKRFPECLIYATPDADIIHHLISDAEYNNKDQISQLVVFDQCLTGKFIQTKQFKNLLDGCRNKKIAIIVMTKDADVICSTLASKLDYILLHGFTSDWTERVSVRFISHHPAASSQKELEHHIISCTRGTTCLAFCRMTPYTLSQF